MKKLNFSRAGIIRAIRAALYSLLLMAATQQAQAQVVSTPPFTQVSGSTYTTTVPYAGPGTFYSQSGVYYVTVNATTTLSNTTASQGGATQFSDAGTDLAIGGGTFTNSGAISQTLITPSEQAYSAVALYGSSGTTDTTLTNTGTIYSSATGTTGQSAAGVSFDNSNGTARSLTLNNQGTLTGIASDAAFGVNAVSDGTGNISINNTGTGSGIIATSSSSFATSIYTDGTTGSIEIESSALLQATGSTSATGLSAITMSGPITITNSGYVHINAGGTGSGIYASLQSDGVPSLVSITNSGYVKVTGSSASGISVDDSSFGSATITNLAAGTIAVTSSAGGGSALSAISNGTATITNNGIVSSMVTDGGDTSYGMQFGGDNMVVVNSGSVSAQNTGVSSGGTSSAAYAVNGLGQGDMTISNFAAGILIATSTGNAAGADVFTYGNSSATHGTVMVTNQGKISGTSSGYNGYGVEATSFLGSVAVTNSGLVSGIGSQSAYGVYAQNETNQFSTGNITVANTGEIDGGSTGSNYIAYGVNAGAEGDITVTNTHGGTNSYSSSSATGLISAVAPDGSAYGVLADASGALTLTNSGTIQATVNNNGQAVGVQAISSGDLTLTNNANSSITASGVYGNGYGVSVGLNGAGNMLVTNNGTISALGGPSQGQMSGTFTSLSASSSGSGYTTIINNATLTAASPYGGANGIIVGSSASGPVQITNNASGTITVTGGGSTAFGINSSTTNGATVTNSGTVMVTGSGGYGIHAFDNSSSCMVINSSSGTITAIATNGGQSAVGVSSSCYGGTASTVNAGIISAMALGGTASGVYTAGEGESTVMNSGTISASNYLGNSNGVVVRQMFQDDATVTNSGHISSTITGTMSSGSAYGVSILVGENITVTNSASGSIDASTAGNGYALAIQAVSYGAAINVSNAGSLVAEGTGYSSGINTASHYGNGTTISNSGTITATGSTTSGVSAYDPSAITITNNAGGSIISSGQTSSSGIYVDSSGTIALTNAGSITASSANGDSYGIDVVTGGDTTINNSGTISSTGTGGVGYGIYADPSNTVTVNNTGEVTGTTYGIDLANGGSTVNNSGYASGGTDSIFVRTGSAVNLTGASPISGLIKGGIDDTSTSLLDIKIVVRTDYQQAKADLDAAIVAYGQEQAVTPQDMNHDVTSEVVVLNGFDYQWQDFASIGDDLIQGRLYETYAGYNSLGRVLDDLNTTNADAANILTSLDALPEGAVADALAQLSPKELEIFRNIAFDNNTFNVSKINNHLANLRDGLTGFDSSQITINDSGMDSSLNQIKSHLLAWNPSPTPDLISDSTDLMFGGTDTKDAKSTEVNTMPTDRWNSFISGDVILADLSNPNVQDADYTTGNVMAGVDFRLDQHFTVGALFAYAHTDANLDTHGSSATVDSYSPGIYGSYVNKGWYANGLATYGRNAYTEDRNIDVPGIAGTNHGGTSGNQGTINLTDGYEFQHGSFKFGPVASEQYVHLNIDSIQEAGGPTALKINEQNQDSFRILLGVEARYVTDVKTLIGKMTLTPHVSASWQHEYLDNNDRGMTSQFNNAGGGSFTVNTDSPDRNCAFIDGGLDATVSKNVTVFIDYETQVGQENFFAQSAQGGVRVGF